MSTPREDGALSHSERLKLEYAPLMRATYDCMGRFLRPGIQAGVAELADLIGRKPAVLRNQFAPTKFDHAPTLHTFFQVIEGLGPGARQAVAAVASLADCVTIPRSPRASEVGAPSDMAEALSKFEALVHKRLQSTHAHLQSGRPLSVNERTEAREALFDIVAYASNLITRVR